MTEKEWLECAQPFRILDFLRHHHNERKLSLFHVAVCRDAWAVLTDQETRQAVEWMERCADREPASVDPGQSSVLDTNTVREMDFRQALPDAPAVTDISVVSAELVLSTDHIRTEDMPAHIGNYCTSPFQFATVASHWVLEAFGPDGAENPKHVALLRHIFGNPFRPYPSPPGWPSAVVKLAEAMYAGEDCSFALHDALLEAGHPELAEHFKEKDHPKGCWVVDAILGRHP